ncbi:uncharacterized protein LOC141631914 [Silene latifolia]|uniref:uncharacterized protein LOC141631914 n=1 Tax=Silene latifolia TaxID=37657 RepID=UPI003D770411
MTIWPGGSIQNQQPTHDPRVAYESVRDRQYLEIKDMLSRIPGMSAPLKKATPDSYADSPFIDAISLVTMLKGFSAPTMTLCDGTTDPFDHVSQYKLKMMVITTVGHLKEACMCKGFGSTLSGAALQWFVGLPNRSISTFVDLVNTFTQQFASNRKPEKHTSDLYRVVQGFDEKIRDFITRFNKEKVAIRGSVEAFRQGLHQDSDLYKDLTRHPCRTFEDVQAKATATMSLEEDVLDKRSLPSVERTSKKSAREKEERPKPYSRIVNKVEDREDTQSLPRLTVKRHATEVKGNRGDSSCKVTHSNLPAITFDEVDIYDSQEHHNALIITLSMANCTVKKVLVDTGSSVNLVMLEKKHGIQRERPTEEDYIFYWWDSVGTQRIHLERS